MQGLKSPDLARRRWLMLKLLPRKQECSKDYYYRHCLHWRNYVAVGGEVVTVVVAAVAAVDGVAAAGVVGDVGAAGLVELVD